MAKTLNVKIAAAKSAKGDLFVVPCFERGKCQTHGLPAGIASAARTAAGRNGFSGKRRQRAFARSSAPGTPTVVVRGLGGRRDFDRELLVKWAADAMAEGARDGFKTPVLLVPEHDAVRSGAAAEELMRTLMLSRYGFREFRSKKAELSVRSVSLVPPEGSDGEYKSARPTAIATSVGAVLTRDLANTPPNEAYPEWMAAQAKKLAKRHGMKVRVLGPKEFERRGMGGILAVGKGSARPPRLAILEWGDGDEVVALVGKGVTFDTGGISIKPPAGMDEMKFDKTGACTVMGIARAVAELDLPFRFRAYLAFAENMPGGAAYRPGDIVKCFNGKTVEILNTDAEGRMLLADALALAESEGAGTILDYATLTGACVVALGHGGAGLFTHNDTLANELLGASGEVGEKLWRLPLWKEFSKAMEGRHADLRNAGGRWGGASTAAAFLSNFVRSKNWAHLDIAGPAYVGRSRKGPFGATGYGVALTVRWLQQRAG